MEKTAKAMSSKSDQTIYMFSYGSLMDPDVLQIIAHLDEPPTLTPAYIDGFKMKMWMGKYPTIMPESFNSKRIKGMVWETTDERHITLLQDYETDAYKPVAVNIRRETRLDYEDLAALAFVWADEEDNDDLEEGEFDLEHFQNHVKMENFGFMLRTLEQKATAKSIPDAGNREGN